jgi:hypothetical protein
MGVNDRRLFACPAVIPHDLENASFAGRFVPSIPQCPGAIPREILPRSRLPRLCALRYVPASAHGARPRPIHYFQAVLEGLAERLFEGRQVCAKAPVVTTSASSRAPACVVRGDAAPIVLPRTSFDLPRVRMRGTDSPDQIAVPVRQAAPVVTRCPWRPKAARQALQRAVDVS